VRSIFKGSLGEFGLDSCCAGAEIGRWREMRCWSLSEGSGCVACGSVLVLALLGNVSATSESNCVMSRLLSNSTALPSCSSSRLITPRVQCITPAGRMALGCIRVTPSALSVSLDCEGHTSARKVAMLASSWGFEAAVTNGMQRKCVRGDFFAAGGFRRFFGGRGI
jgi:hypothetical protein